QTPTWHDACHGVVRIIEPASHRRRASKERRVTGSRTRNTAEFAHDPHRDGRYGTHLPGRPYSAATTSLGVHTLVVSTVIFAATSIRQQATASPSPIAAAQTPFEHLVFIAHESAGPVAGGGGGGNRQSAPIRRAEAPGADPMTLRVARPVSI